MLTRNHVEDWRHAISLLGDILITHGNSTPEYVQAVEDAISAPGGTYMDIGFGIVLAHARPEAGALQTGLSLLHLDQPVLLADDPNHPATLFIGLAATDSQSHLALMQDLAAVLVDPDRRQLLLEASTPDAVLSALSNKE